MRNLDLYVGLGLGTLALFSLTGKSRSPLSLPSVRVDQYYPAFDITVSVVDTSEVARQCASVERLDNGTPVEKGTQFSGCYDDELRHIYVDSKDPEVLFHELCHAGGRSPEYCDHVQWPN